MQDVQTQNKNQTVLVEQTSKKWKGLKLAGILIFIIGGVALIVSPNGFTGFLLFLGIALYMVSRFGAWWHHK